MNLIIISSDLQRDIAFTSSINNDTTIFNYTTPKPLEDGSFEGTQSTIINVLDTIGSNDIKRVALAYHYSGYYKIPFFSTNVSSAECAEGSTYKYFSNDLVELFKQMNEKTSEPLIVDILTCSLNNPEFQACVSQIESDLGINIQYSLDPTGNSPQGNWVLESDNVNVKDVYFTEDINNWSSVLTDDITTYVNGVVSSITGISYDAGTKTYTLTQNVELGAALEAIAVAKSDATYKPRKYFIDLGANGVFDGAGFTMNFDGGHTQQNAYIEGLFKCSDTQGSPSIIRDLGILALVNTSIYTSSCKWSYMVKNSQKYFEITNCYVSGGNIVGDGGGFIAGSDVGHSGNCTINKCYSTGNIHGNGSGGICGSQAGYGGVCTITNCYSTGDINYGNCGGIVGIKAGYMNGSCTITNCYTTGTFGSGTEHAGLIAGAEFGNNGTGIMSKCYSTGEIGGSQMNGGLVGYQAGQSGINSLISDCYTTGDVTSANNGGLAGKNCKMAFVRCYQSGAITHNYGSGFTRQGQTAETFSQTNCYTHPISFGYGSVYGDNDVADISGSIGNLGGEFTAVPASYPILNSFQATPWDTDTNSADYYDLYTDAAKLVSGGGTTSEETEADSAGVSGGDVTAIAANSSIVDNTVTTIPENCISGGTVGANIRRRRVAVTKLLFAANTGITKFILPRTSLALSASYSQKSNTKVFKPSETIDISADTDENTSWYCPFGDGESVTINPTGGGNEFTLSKASDVYTIAGTDPYVIDVVSDVSGVVDGILTGFVDGDTCTVNGEPVVFGSAGAGEGGVACFMKGTKILTINGYKLVENITLQDKLICKKGSILLIKNLKVSIVKSSIKTYPYLIPKGKYQAIEDLYISRNHSINIEGFFVPVKKIKGLKQVILEQEFIEYYHIITDNMFSDIILANGVEVETYLDINKLTFDTYKKYKKLYYNNLEIRKIDNCDSNLNEIIKYLKKDIRKKIKNKKSI